MYIHDHILSDAVPSLSFCLTLSSHSGSPAHLICTVLLKKIKNKKLLV